LIAYPSFDTAFRRLVDSFCFRQSADAVFRARARCDIARFDRGAAGRCQLRTLLGLVNAARATPFGREHDFRRIRTAADFRRLVPLRARAELGRAGAPPVLGGHRLLRGTFRAAWGTALAFVVGARPQARLLSGRLVFLGGAGSDAARLPWLTRPYALAEDHADRLTEAPVTCLAGPADQIASLVDRIRDLTQGKRISEIWPRLTAVLYDRASPADDPAPPLRAALGGSVLLLETRFLPEGPVAVEDPRRGCLSLLYDHGVYFEFTPAAEADKPEPTRHGLAEVEPGVVYELALTSPAGVWACRTGVAVRFERRDPPLFLLSEMPAAPPIMDDARKLIPSPPCPAPAPHRQIAGIPAAPPGTFAHTPWSTPADRG
jgi:GH3 auxin-responsive promoter